MSARRIRIAKPDGFDVGERLRVELELRGGDVLLELRHRRRADDRYAEVPAAPHVTEERHRFTVERLGEIVVDAARNEAVAVLQRNRARDAELARSAPEFAHAP